MVTPAVLLGLLLAGCSEEKVVSERPLPEVPAATTPVPAATAEDPNIVLVLMDDFSTDLLPSLASAARMAREGASYPHSYVVDSLCCVSRSSLFTGQYPHQTGVRTNTSGVSDGDGPIGGYPAFRDHGNRERSFNVRLQQAGYTTGFVGKYLNEYEYVAGAVDMPPVPPGWSEFNVLFGSAYMGWDFDSTHTEDGQVKVRHHPAPDADASDEEKDAAYAGQVTEDYALDFIRRHRDSDTPYFLEVAPYAPHSRTNKEGAWPGEPLFPAAFRDRPRDGRPGNCGPVACSEFTKQALPGYRDDAGDNTPVLADGTPAPAWNHVPPALPDRAYIASLRQRAQMVQSVDRTVQKILDEVGDDTYVVFTSDNGFHLAQNGLSRGKGTAYDTDARVPLLVVGPGITPGERREMTTNIDLAPTFEQLAGLKPEPFRSGRSLVPSLLDADSSERDHVFVEHTSEPGQAGDPDRAFNGHELDRIPGYLAVRSRTGLLIRSDLGPLAGHEPDEPLPGYEFYSYDQVPWERRNQFTDPRYAPEVKALMAKLEAFDRCAGARGDDPVTPRCRRALR